MPSRTIFKYYPRVEGYLEEQKKISTQQKAKIEKAEEDERPLRQREQELLSKLQEAIYLLKESGRWLTLQALTDEMGIKPSTLYYYTRVLSSARQAIEEAKRVKSRETELFKRTEDAIQLLHISGRPITIYAVARELEISASSLTNYVEIIDLIREEREKKLHLVYYEQELFTQVIEVIQLLKTQKRRLTLRAICAELGRSVTFLHYYPKILSMAKHEIQKEGYLVSQMDQKRQEILSQVKLAIERLQGRKNPLTINAICKETGRGKAAIYRYPEVISYIKQELTEYLS